MRNLRLGELQKPTAAGTDIVLIDPQYVPATTKQGTEEKTGRMVSMLGDIAHAKRIARFPRFAMMRRWHHDDKMAFDQFSIPDGLHMNDWGYACFAQLLGDDIIRSVGQIRLGINVPANVQAYRPM